MTGYIALQENGKNAVLMVLISLFIQKHDKEKRNGSGRVKKVRLGSSSASLALVLPLLVVL